MPKKNELTIPKDAYKKTVTSKKRNARGQYSSEDGMQLTQYLQDTWMGCPVDMDNPTEVIEAVNTYFENCNANEIPPTVAGLAHRFNRSVKWLSAVGMGELLLPNSDAQVIIQRAMSSINEMLEVSMIKNTIPPLTGMYLTKNHFGYQDEHKSVVVNETPNTMRMEDIIELTADDFEDKT